MRFLPAFFSRLPYSALHLHAHLSPYNTLLSHTQSVPQSSKLAGLVPALIFFNYEQKVLMFFISESSLVVHPIPPVLDPPILTHFLAGKRRREEKRRGEVRRGILLGKRPPNAA